MMFRSKNRVGQEEAGRKEGEAPLFPRIAKIRDLLPKIASPSFEPSGKGKDERLRMLEAKVEYLLDQVYRLKSTVRFLAPGNPRLKDLQNYQIETFNFQWKRLPYHDEFLTNPEWRAKSSADVARRLGVDPSWFAGKRILDAGCGPGRHTWTFASLGASVDAFDMSDNGLEQARKECRDFPRVTINKHNVLQDLPYPNDYDLVWCYGVVHCTGDTFAALQNIASHVKPGGTLYFMVYTEPRRDNVFDYTYYHEIETIRDAIRHLDFETKAKILEQLEGKSHALAWFDAISSEVNDLYTTEELIALLGMLGFGDVKRTMPEESMQNIVARKL